MVWRAVFRSIAALPLAALLAAPPVSGASAAVVHSLEVRGAIGVAVAEFIESSFKQAEIEGASLIVLSLDTPGGLVTSARAIVKTILASPVPVAVYVAPGGAQAASAGTYILYAAHIAAMAPGTNMGAATPVSLGGPPGSPGDAEDKKKAPEKATPAQDTAMERKVVNDAVAWIRSLAQLRGRNAEWAEKAVREAATLTADDAARENVIDLVARNLPELLAKLDGRDIVAGGRKQVLTTKDAIVVDIVPDWRSRLIAVITDPNVAYILMLVGIYGIIFEFWNPGLVLPGVAGGISLLLALAALSVLPVDYAGIGLILLGLALMLGEAFTPGIGVLGIGGLLAFVVGSVFLYDPSIEGPDARLAWPVIAAAASSAGVLAVVVGMAGQARRRPVVSGQEDMIGASAKVIDWKGQSGRVRFRGETWNAQAATILRPDDAVRVVGVKGLKLIVEAVTSGG